MKQRVLAMVLVVCTPSLLQAAVQATFYVSPTGTGDFSQARPGPLSGIVAKVRTVNTHMTGDIVVMLKGGRYELPSTFALGAADGGTGGHYVIYQAAPGETPILSGGSRVTGKWVVSDAGKNIYKTNVGTALDTRQLYVNGKRAVRARSVDGSGWSLNGSSFTCPSSVASWKNLTHVEIVDNSNWRSYRMLISSVSGTTAQVAKMFGVSWAPAVNPTWIENAYELLDAEGEWYLDRTTGDLFYKPRAGETMSNAEVIIPKLQSLVTLTSVNYLQFVGLTISHSTWLQVSTSGLSLAQADFGTTRGPRPTRAPTGRPTTPADAASTTIPLSIALDHCKNVRFQGNTIEHMGSTAIGLEAGCQNTTLEDNIIRDVSGSGIRVGNNNPRPAEADLLKDDSICNNLICDVANEYLGSCGIFACFTEHLVVTHNEIRNCPYTGISLGWSWNTDVTCAKDNEIAYNRIDSIMTMLKDGGGVYILGNQPGTTVHDNYITHQRALFGNLYLDNGCTGTHWYKNVVSDGVFWAMLKGTNTVDNNYMSNFQNGDEPCDQSNGGTVPTDNTYVENYNWPEAAKTIISNAGRVQIPSEAISTPSVNPPSR